MKRFCEHQTSDKPDYCRQHNKKCPYTFEDVDWSNIADGIKVGKRDKEGNLIDICEDFSLNKEG